VLGTSSNSRELAAVSSLAWVSERLAAQRIGLRLAAPFGNGFGELANSTVNHSPQDDLELENRYALRR